MIMNCEIQFSERMYKMVFWLAILFQYIVTQGHGQGHDCIVIALVYNNIILIIIVVSLLIPIPFYFVLFVLLQTHSAIIEP